MRQITIENLIKVTQGKWYGPDVFSEDEAVSIVTDSRKAETGSVFIAIKGERSDGHDYIGGLLDEGVLCCIGESVPEGCEGVILVESSVKAMRAIAEFYLEVMDIPVVGITGSVGKTSTKEMIASVLSQRYKVRRTAGNFNNEIGLPLTVFGIRDDDEIAVLEMGISHFGDMEILASVAKPDVMVITNIGPCHLEFLGDLDGVLKEKTVSLSYLKDNALVVLNGDDEKLQTIQAADIKNAKNVSVSFFGQGTKANDGMREVIPDARATKIEPLGVRGMKVDGTLFGEEFSVAVPIPGMHVIYNVLAAMVVGYRFGLTIDEMSDGIKNVPTLPGRNNLIICSNITVFDDCYNANPVSMQSALRTLSQEKGRTIAVLGDMGELGEDSQRLHFGTGECAGECGIDVVFTVGALGREIAAGVKGKNPSCDCRSFDTIDEILPTLKAELKGGDTVLVKASHFMKFENIVKYLTTEFADKK